MRVNKQMKITAYMGEHIPEKSGFTVFPMKEKQRSSDTKEILYWLCSVNFYYYCYYYSMLKKRR